MVLLGKLTTELGIKSPAEKFYNLFASQLHDVHTLCDRVHHAKVHEGEDWHDTETVKHWTYVIGNIYVSISIEIFFNLWQMKAEIIKSIF
jgi:uncharacterized membrane protein YkgB